MGSPRPCRRPPRPATCSSSMPPARWSSRCISRPPATTRRACEIVLIGHAGHPEVGAPWASFPPGAVTPGRDRRGRARLHAPRPRQARLRHADHPVGRRHGRDRRRAESERFPRIVGPHKEDICYATTNRQAAVKAIAPRIGCLLVVGSPQSSNSLRLVEVAERAGCPKARADRARARHPLGDARGRRQRRRHRRRLGAGGRWSRRSSRPCASASR